MSEQTETPIAEYRDLRFGVNDSYQLFSDRVEVRWKRSTQSGEHAVPLTVISPHFHRTCGTGTYHVRLFQSGLVLIVLAIFGANLLPVPYSDYVGIGAGIGGALCWGANYYRIGLPSNDTRWTFVNLAHSATLFTVNARQQDIAAVEAFVGALVEQIKVVQKVAAVDEIQ